MLFSHPKDFTPVCTTELGYMAAIEPEFDKRNVKVIGLSVDPLENHEGWANDIEETQGTAPNYPLICDADFSISKALRDAARPTSPATPPTAPPPTTRRFATSSSIGPDKKIKLILVYPMTTGRNFDEVLRVIDSLQLTANHKVATPAQWKQGDDVIIAGSVSNDEAKELFPDGWEAPRPTSGSSRNRSRPTHVSTGAGVCLSEMSATPGWTTLERPIGLLTVVAGERGIANVHFEGHAPALPEATRRSLPRAVDQLQAYFAGERRAFELGLDLGGTPLQRAVWERLLRSRTARRRPTGRSPASLMSRSTTRARRPTGGRARLGRRSAATRSRSSSPATG